MRGHLMPEQRTRLRRGYSVLVQRRGDGVAQSVQLDSR